MKSKELIRSLSLSDILKVSIFSSLGFCVFFFVLGSILILMGASAPVTLNESEISGLKGFLILLATLPLYVVLIFLMQVMILGLGLWISKRLFLFKK